MIGLPQGDSPLLLNTSYTITADIEVPQGGAEGMILTSGGRFAGYGFYLLKGKPVFLWNLVDLERIKWEGPDALTPGRHTVEFDFKYDGIGAGTLAFNNFSGLGRPGTGTLKVDGKVVDTKRMAKTLPMILQWDESFDIGSDTLTGVNDADYKPPFPLTAKLNKLTIKVDRPQLSPADIKKLQAAMHGEGEEPTDPAAVPGPRWESPPRARVLLPDLDGRDAGISNTFAYQIFSPTTHRRRLGRRVARAQPAARQIRRRHGSIIAVGAPTGTVPADSWGGRCLSPADYVTVTGVRTGRPRSRVPTVAYALRENVSVVS